METERPLSTSTLSPRGVREAHKMKGIYMTEIQEQRVQAQTCQMYNDAIVIISIEEMAELIQALCKTLRLMLGDNTIRKTEKEVSAMVDEEIADTEIALNRLVDIMGYQGQRMEKVKQIIEHKIDRMDYILGKENEDESE